VFGSVARDTATADSDRDLLVDVEPGCGYFAIDLVILWAAASAVGLLADL
jgi:predicted nucleotidyltransferase